MSKTAVAPTDVMKATSPSRRQKASSALLQPIPIHAFRSQAATAEFVSGTQLRASNPLASRSGKAPVACRVPLGGRTGGSNPGSCVPVDRAHKKFPIRHGHADDRTFHGSRAQTSLPGFCFWARQGASCPRRQPVKTSDRDMVSKSETASHAAA